MLEKGKEEGWGVPLFEITDEGHLEQGLRRLLTWSGDLRTRRDVIAERPDDVQAMITGLCKGADFIFANSSEEVVDLIHADYLTRLLEGLCRRRVSRPSRRYGARTI